ncbi:MAG TPA: hypothetical protein VEH27_13325 [Methylomirabilota bacterium]|nr:hypothetical protein [Methylomirabilota bacterium]
MKRLLTSPVLSTFIGAATFFGTLTLMVSRQAEQQAHAAAQVKPEIPVWNPSNPEIDKLVSELKTERQALEKRRKEIDAVAEQFKAQRIELNDAMQRVQQLQAELDKQIVQVKADEIPNLKKQAKIYASMAPESAAQILNEMEDSAIVKLLASMKEDESAQILESLLKVDAGAAKRAAELSDQLRRYLAPKAAKK